MHGVPLDQLRCPTCGERFKSDVSYDRDESLVMSTCPVDIVESPRPYLTCEAGHRWTVKIVTRTANRPDDVLLDRYIGDAGKGRP